VPVLSTLFLVGDLHIQPPRMGLRLFNVWRHNTLEPVIEEGGDWKVLDVREAGDVKARVTNHERADCWKRNCSGIIRYSGDVHSRSDRGTEKGD
jgi:hypothetical protein